MNDNKPDKIKILVAGLWCYKIYEAAYANGFKQQGHEVFCFKVGPYLGIDPESGGMSTDGSYLNQLSLKIQRRLIWGPQICLLNKQLLNEADKIKPDLIFVRKGVHLYPKTIAALSKQGAVVFGYNNDDPFSQISFQHRLFTKSLPYYHHAFAYRHKNVEDFINHGAQSSSLLRSHYIKEEHFPLSGLQDHPFSSDVVFIGHYEPDGRDMMLNELLKQKFKVKIFGTQWEDSPYYEHFTKTMGEIKPVRGKDYNLAINHAKIALVFLSKLNKDTYTRRCFEIPATKTMMLSEYTDDLAQLFPESFAAEYFRSTEELINKTKLYLQNDELRTQLANNSYSHLLKNKHELVDRCEQIINKYYEIRERKYNE